MGEILQIGIKYKGFKIKRFAYEDLQKVDQGDDFQIQLSTGLEINVNRIIVPVLVEIRSSQNSDPVASAETQSVFDIQGLEDKEGDPIDLVPEGLLITAISLSISTTRGAVLTKGAGSFLEHVILPIVNPKDFLPDKQELKKKKD